MLFWTKLLTIAHSITTSVYPFLPLYYTLMLKFDILTISILTACTLLLRLPASIFWINIVDHRPTLHGVFTGLLTALGTAGILLILSVPPSWTSLTLPVAIISSIFDGLFYQPLLVLIDSAIVKILGDYKILYVNERQYGKFVSAIMAICIGWLLDDDHDFDTLMVTTLVGSVILFLLSLSTNVQAVDHDLLDIPQTEEVIIDETSPLTKHAMQPVETSSSYLYYKPYSLFGEHLSHISEEDASMLQRIPTINSVSIRPPPITSIHSSCVSYNITNCTEDNNIPNYSSYQHTTFPSHITRNIQPNSEHPSFELARLPYPPPEAPAVVLITLVSNYNKQNNQLASLDEEYYYLQCSLETHQHYQQRSRWILKSFISSIFCLGLVYGMTQSLLYLYLHETLGLPMHTIGIIGLVKIAADLLANKLVIWIIQRYQLSVIIASAHILLAICTFAYTWLDSNMFAIESFVIVLQCLQGLFCHLIWLLAAHQVDSAILTDHKRIMLKGGMSAFYSCLGPALGVILVGYLVAYYGNDGYILLYQYATGFTILGGILSWEWTTSD